LWALAMRWLEERTRTRTRQNGMSPCKEPMLFDRFKRPGLCRNQCVEGRNGWLEKQGQIRRLYSLHFLQQFSVVFLFLRRRKLRRWTQANCNYLLYITARFFVF
jgi:hypothetical protein